MSASWECSTYRNSKPETLHPHKSITFICKTFYMDTNKGIFYFRPPQGFQIPTVPQIGLGLFPKFTNRVYTNRGVHQSRPPTTMATSFFFCMDTDWRHPVYNPFSVVQIIISILCWVIHMKNNLKESVVKVLDSNFDPEMYTTAQTLWNQL